MKNQETLEVAKEALELIDNKVAKGSYLVFNEYVKHIPRETKLGALRYFYKNEIEDFNQMLAQIKSL